MTKTTPSISITGTFVFPTAIKKGTLIVEERKIVQFEESKYHPNPTYDYTKEELYIMPGAIEVHGHFREPGFEEKEDIPHGTKAALAGGYTTVFDMPNTKPPTTTVARVKDQIERYTNRSYTDFAINMGTAVEDIAELEKINTSDINAVKIFTAGHATTPTTIPHLGDVARIFSILSKRHITALVHAENQELVNYFTHLYKDVLHRNDPLVWGEVRNTSVVLTAALEMIALAKQFNVRLYLLHLSTPEEFKAVEFAKSLGVEAYGETVTYQLAFSTEDYKTQGNLVNVAPALRTPKDQKALWELLREGKIDTVCSEHTPHLLKDKEKDVWDVSSGMPDIQESLPALITGWVSQFGKETLKEGLIRIGNVTAKNIAEIFSYKQKGTLENGKDADFSIIDVTTPWKVSKKDILSKCGWSAYENKELIGKPQATFLRGEKVYDQGNFAHPQGKWIKKIHE